MKEALKQMLNDIDVGLKNALIRVNELVAENKALKEALAQPEQEPDDLTIAYMSGLYDGKKKRPWVGLTDDEIHDTEGYEETREMYRFARAIEAASKEKNT